ncbi:MAG: PilZ domain-containing protein [Deltaproteobacteria bacterium]|nr:PilZ domain-containing protein [Deltaproteobacteria bacterium]
MSERWPVTVLTRDGEASGETRSLTVEGVFFHCPQRLKEGELCHMRIGLPENPVEVRGELAWSNLENFKPEHTIPGMGFCFVRISREDREQFGEALASLTAKKNPAES